MLKYVLSLISCALLIFGPSTLHAFGGCEQDCMKCHNLSNEDAEKVLKPLIRDVKVENVKISDAKGIWEITLKSDGKSGTAYIDFSLKNIIVGRIIPIKTMINLSQERFKNVKKVDVAKIPIDDALVIGDGKAKSKVIVFDDPD